MTIDVSVLADTEQRFAARTRERQEIDALRAQPPKVIPVNTPAAPTAATAPTR